MLRHLTLPIPPVGWRGLAAEELSTLLQRAIAPYSWGPGGGGEIVALPGSLVVVHLPEIHVQIVDLLHRLECWRFPADPTEVIPLGPPPLSRYEQRLRRILERPANVELFRAELPIALEFLSRDFDIPVVIQPEALADALLVRKAPVTINARGVPLGKSLHERQSTAG